MDTITKLLDAVIKTASDFTRTAIEGVTAKFEKRASEIEKSISDISESWTKQFTEVRKDLVVFLDLKSFMETFPEEKAGMEKQIEDLKLVIATQSARLKELDEKVLPLLNHAVKNGEVLTELESKIREIAGTLTAEWRKEAAALRTEFDSISSGAVLSDQEALDTLTGAVEAASKRSDDRAAEFETRLVALREILDSLKDAPIQIEQSRLEECVRKMARSYIESFAMDFERRAQDVFFEAISRIPKPKDGVDAVPLDLFGVDFDETTRTLTFTLGAGEEKRSGSIRLSYPIYRGVHAAETRYLKGDSVTWGGSLWIAQTDTDDRPGNGSEAWMLAVKKGRDGKDAREIKAAPSYDPNAR